VENPLERTGERKLQGGGSKDTQQFKKRGSDKANGGKSGTKKTGRDTLKKTPRGLEVSCIKKGGGQRGRGFRSRLGLTMCQQGEGKKVNQAKKKRLGWWSETPEKWWVTESRAVDCLYRGVNHADRGMALAQKAKVKGLHQKDYFNRNCLWALGRGQRTEGEPDKGGESLEGFRNVVRG